MFTESQEGLESFFEFRADTFGGAAFYSSRLESRRATDSLLIDCLVGMAEDGGSV
jgi:hypothetical protein